MSRSLRCVAEVSLDTVSRYLARLTEKNDVYISVQLFNQQRQTRLVSSIFPLIFNETLRFDKVFYGCYRADQVADRLAGETILIELIQLSDIYDGGRLLASYETSAQEFLNPYSSFGVTYNTVDRTALLEPSANFPGISPRLRFSTRTVLSDSVYPILDYYPRYRYYSDLYDYDLELDLLEDPIYTYRPYYRYTTDRYGLITPRVARRYTLGDIRSDYNTSMDRLTRDLERARLYLN